MLEHSDEIAALVTEDVTVAAKEVVEVAKNNYILLGAVTVISLGVGAVVGYQFCQKRLTTKFDEILKQEIEMAKDFYKKLNKVEEYATPEDAVNALLPEGVVEVADSVVDNILRYQGREKPIPYDKPVAPNLVMAPPESVVLADTPHLVEGNDDTQDDNFNYITELPNRRPDTPYVISFDEFNENEPSYVQTSATYYEGDDVLVDERDSPMEDFEDSVGLDNLLRFGHGSRDRNTVYVRNDVLELDYEIVRSPGEYAEEVLGVLKHSHLRKFRRGDDE